MNSFVMSILFQHRTMPQRTMPTTDPAMTNAKKMNKEKLKKKKLEKKLEDEYSDYEPNLIEAKDSDDEVDVSNCKPPPETIAVQKNDRVSHSSDTVTDGTEKIPPPRKRVAVPNLNTNDH
jgi:hypothetical protein